MLIDGRTSSGWPRRWRPIAWATGCTGGPASGSRSTPWRSRCWKQLAPGTRSIPPASRAAAMLSTEPRTTRSRPGYQRLFPIIVTGYGLGYRLGAVLHFRHAYLAGSFRCRRRRRRATPRTRWRSQPRTWSSRSFEGSNGGWSPAGWHGGLIRRDRATPRTDPPDSGQPADPDPNECGN